MAAVKKTAKKETKKATSAKKAATKKVAPVKKATTPKATGKKAEKKTAAKKTAARKAAPKPRVISAEERFNMIQTAAYYIAERNGFAGDSSRFWVEAELEIEQRLANER